MQSRQAVARGAGSADGTLFRARHQRCPTEWPKPAGSRPPSGPAAPPSRIQVWTVLIPDSCNQRTRVNFDVSCRQSLQNFNRFTRNFRGELAASDPKQPTLIDLKPEREPES